MLPRGSISTWSGAVHENRPEFYEYLKRSALGLLVFAYVFGALAGVGIWQTTTAANPRGISTLIHNFVLYWGAEWYMFLIDVIGIIVYYYTLGPGFTAHASEAGVDFGAGRDGHAGDYRWYFVLQVDTRRVVANGRVAGWFL